MNFVLDIPNCAQMGYFCGDEAVQAAGWFHPSYQVPLTNSSAILGGLNSVSDRLFAVELLLQQRLSSWA